MDDSSVTTKPIKEVMQKPFPIVDRNTAIDEVAKLINKDVQAVLLDLGNGKHHIITKYDIISGFHWYGPNYNFEWFLILANNYNMFKIRNLFSFRGFNHALSALFFMAIYACSKDDISVTSELDQPDAGIENLLPLFSVNTNGCEKLIIWSNGFLIERFG